MNYSLYASASNAKRTFVAKKF